VGAGDDSGDTIDTESAATLLHALLDPDVEIRTSALAALVVLPLTPDAWIEVARHANAVLADAARPSDERLAVIEATPWIPIASTRGHAERLVAAAREPALRDAARAALASIAGAPEVPTWSPVAPAGFSSPLRDDRERLRRELSGSSPEALLSDLEHSWRAGDPTRAAYLVTSLLQTAGSTHDHDTVQAVLSFVERTPGFSPDLEGLFALILRDEEAPRRSFLSGRGIRWIVSRGGVADLVDQLGAALTSARREVRLCSLGLIRDAAGYVGSRTPPMSFLGGPRYPPWEVPPRRDVLDVDVADVSLEDDDVQFSLYRPSQVKPDEWVPLVAFAHRTAPITMPDGRTLRPVEEVERRAAQLLADMPASYEVVRADSDAGLPRGTDLRFEPWVEEGEFNPSAQTLRWEEAVHEVHFRLRVPGSLDGSRVRGGMRVFAGPLLIGDLTFRLLVSRDEPAGAVPTEHDTARRFRQIFASYSHRDTAVVEAVERFVSVTGDRYLVDAETLRSGEVWDDRLCQLIEGADVFQLFWSRHAMNSEFVRREWEYALALGRDGFVRPVFWEEPLAEDPMRDLPPAALKRLHFSRLRVDPKPSAVGSAPTDTTRDGSPQQAEQPAPSPPPAARATHSRRWEGEPAPRRRTRGGWRLITVVAVVAALLGTLLIVLL
jgi:hypothetical protein